MANLENAPDAWVGARITLVYNRAEKTSSVACDLKGVHERGVVVEYKEYTQFYPWTAIVRIQLGETPPSRAVPKPRGF